VDVKQLSRELGVRYVVEGSVRKVDERVRVTAQLIDATTGGHVWAEQYDRELKDIFAIQDEITTAIAAAMGARLTVAEQERAASKPLGTLDGWESLMRGLSHLTHGHAHLSGEENARARPFLEGAIELDPNAASPRAMLAMSHLMDAHFGWTGDPARSLALGRRAAEAAVSLDNEEPVAHCALGTAHELSGQPQKAIAAYEIAIQLRPSYADAYSFLAGSLAWDRPDEALAHLDTAMHLSPRDSRMYHWFFIGARAHFVAGRDAETVAWAEKSLQRNPGFWGGYVYLAASCAHLKRAEEARAAVEELLRLQPDYSLARIESTLATRPAAYAERILDGLRKAGLPE
jgi:tetratricopeptide (TPR) repeat protein